MNVKIIFLLTGTIVRKLPRKLEVLEGENAMFCVEVEKDDMESHWFKDGYKLHETHYTILKSFGKTHILVFVNVTHQDSGVVTFVTGRSKTSSRLKVKCMLKVSSICLVSVTTRPTTYNHLLLLLPFFSFSSHKTLPSYLPRRGQNGH